MRPAGSRSCTATPVAASGPALVRVTVKVIVSPTFGVGLLTVLVIARSACCGVSVALAVLLPGLGSNWSAAVMVAVLVCAAGPATVAVRVSVACAPLASAPTVQRPVAGSYVPWLGRNETRGSPAGSRSVTSTPVASAGPLSPSVTVKVTVSPTLGRGLLTLLLSARLAARGSIEAVSLLLAVFGSNWSAWLTEAEFASGLALTTLAVMIRVWGAPGATVPTVQTPVTAS